MLAIIPLTVTCKLTLALTVSPLNPNLGQESSYTVLTIAAGSFFTLYGQLLVLVLAQGLPGVPSAIQEAMTVIHPVVCLTSGQPSVCVLVIRQAVSG